MGGLCLFKECSFTYRSQQHDIHMYDNVVTSAKQPYKQGCSNLVYIRTTLILCMEYYDTYNKSKNAKMVSQATYVA